MDHALRQPIPAQGDLLAPAPAPMRSDATGARADRGRLLPIAAFGQLPTVSLVLAHLLVGGPAVAQYFCAGRISDKVMSRPIVAR